MGRAASYFVGRKKTVRQRACGRVTEGRFCRKVVGVRDGASGVRFTDDETGDAEVMPILPEPAEPLFFRHGSGWIPVKGLLSGNVADCTGNGG